jgi:Flp pilus assembly protein TadG
MRLIGKFKQGINKHEGNSHPKGKAQGMTEFALILPLLVALLFGVIEFGRMIFVYSVVYTASREGARYGSAVGIELGSSVPNYNNCDGIIASVERVAILTNVEQIIIAYDEGADANGNPINRKFGCPNPNVEVGRHRISVDVVANYSTFIPLPSIPNNFQIRSESARTIIGDVPVGVFLLPGLYVYDLTGVSNYVSGPRWEADINIWVKDFKNDFIDNAIVTVEWGNGNPQFGECAATGVKGTCKCETGLTGTPGMCSVRIRQIHINRSPVKFIVTDISHPSPNEYDFSSNNYSTIDCYYDSVVCIAN